MNRHYDFNDPNHAHAWADGALGPVCDPVLEEEDALRNEYREAAILAYDFFKRCAAFVVRHRNRIFAFDCWLLAMGWYDLLGCNDEETLGARHNVTKQNVSKCVNMFQARMGHGLARLGPAAGQRSEAARRNMRASRLQQLRTRHHEQK